MKATIGLIDGKWKCVILFHLLDGASDEAAAARVTDRELLRQFQAVEHLPDADKQVVKTLLDAFIAKRQIESIIR